MVRIRWQRLHSFITIEFPYLKDRELSHGNPSADSVYAFTASELVQPFGQRQPVRSLMTNPHPTMNELICRLSVAIDGRQTVVALPLT